MHVCEYLSAETCEDLIAKHPDMVIQFIIPNTLITGGEKRDFTLWSRNEQAQLSIGVIEAKTAAEEHQKAMTKYQEELAIYRSEKEADVDFRGSPRTARSPRRPWSP